MAEGITAITTKIDTKIAKLKEAERRATGVQDENEENEMKSFGLFNIIRGIFRAITSLIGGILANKLNIHTHYIIVGVYPVIMMIYALFIFKEHKVIFFIFSKHT